jgi:Anti-sigma-K factor rskA
MIRVTDDPNQTDLVAGHILGDLSSEEADHLDQALAETPTLSEEIASYGEAFSLLPYALPIVEPAAGLKDKILSAASRFSIDPSPEPPRSNVVPLASPRQRRWNQWIPTISTGIAAGAVIALGWNQVQLNRQVQQTASIQKQLEASNTELQRLRSELQANQATIAQLSQPDAQVYVLVGATSSPKNTRLATARIFAKPSDRTVTIVAHNLPKLQNNQIYRLWSVATPAAAPMYCGQFRQDDGGTAQWMVPSAACIKQPSQLLITLDAPTDPITSAGPLVMRSSS